jgi:hypothetical protein
MLNLTCWGVYFSRLFFLFSNFVSTKRQKKTWINITFGYDDDDDRRRIRIIFISFHLFLLFSPSNRRNRWLDRETKHKKCHAENKMKCMGSDLMIFLFRRIILSLQIAVVSCRSLVRVQSLCLRDCFTKKSFNKCSFRWYWGTHNLSMTNDFFVIDLALCLIIIRCYWIENRLSHLLRCTARFGLRINEKYWRRKAFSLHHSVATSFWGFWRFRHRIMRIKKHEFVFSHASSVD